MLNGLVQVGFSIHVYVGARTHMQLSVHPP